jgi:hypothetical protein
MKEKAFILIPLILSLMIFVIVLRSKAGEKSEVTTMEKKEGWLSSVITGIGMIFAGPGGAAAKTGGSWWSKIFKKKTKDE